MKTAVKWIHFKRFYLFLAKASPTEIEIKAVSEKINTDNIDADKNTVISLTNVNHPINRMKLNRHMSMPGADYENTVNLTLEGYLLTVHGIGHKSHKKGQRVKSKSESRAPNANAKSEFDKELGVVSLAMPEDDRNSIDSNTKSIGSRTIWISNSSIFHNK